MSALLGMQRWKRASIARAFAEHGEAPSFARSPAAALRLARAGGGGIAAWATRVPPGFAERCAAEGIALWHVEDGFLRSVGLGAEFAPAASLCVDPVAPHYDPARAGALEGLLTRGAFAPAVLGRAAALRARIAARGVSKYNLGPAAPLPPSPGRERVLVIGQVEDDAALRLGAAGAVRTNQELLRAARTAHPRAFLVFRPHPDVARGYRRGRVDPRGLADHVSLGGDAAGLYAQVDRVHVVSSLAGFEAILRGVPVTCWGQPFYAGWGLTEDRAPPPRRGIPRTADELAAAALILYPRYTHPVSGRRCAAEDILALLECPEAWPKLHPARRAWLVAWRLGGRALGAVRA